jgi:hypothetical protein
MRSVLLWSPYRRGSMPLLYALAITASIALQHGAPLSTTLPRRGNGGGRPRVRRKIGSARLAAVISSANAGSRTEGLAPELPTGCADPCERNRQQRLRGIFVEVSCKGFGGIGAVAPGECCATRRDCQAQGRSASGTSAALRPRRITPGNLRPAFPLPRPKPLCRLAD